MTMRQRIYWYLGLAALAGFTSFNVFWKLWAAERSGYYSMVAASMATSVHNWFYGAADPGGFLALDKIPGSYWIPAILVKLLGFHNAAAVGPNGVATVLAVIFIAYAGKRIGGIWVGLISGLLFSATPIINAVARSNEPESAFLLSMSVAAYCITVALTGRKRYQLILAGLAIALAFQQYMVMAWAIWPALALAWWFGVATPWGRRLVDLVIAGGISLVASVLWITAVWLTPANTRPYIGNTLHNNPWEMVFGYNALGRFGNSGKMAGLRTGAVSFKTFTPPFSGHPSIIRLFYHQVIGQISWLIPATIVAIVYLVLQRKYKAVVIAFGTWFVTFAVMLSAVSGMHQYYVATFAIPMVLLVSLGVVEAYKNRAVYWLASYGVVSAGMAFLVLKLNKGYLHLYPYAQIFLAVVAAALIIYEARNHKAELRKGALAVLIASVVLTPLAWSVDAKNHPSFVNPMAGPADTYTKALAHKSKSKTKTSSTSSTASKTATTATSTKGISHEKVLTWLQSRPHGKVVLATFGADAAAPYVIFRRAVVLPVGGFNGADPVPTLSQFKQMVANHEINYVLMNHFIGDESAYSTWDSAQIKKWVFANCHKNETPPDKVTLYYCWAK